MYEAITHYGPDQFNAIRVAVEPEFQPDQSDPAKPHFVWFYTVEIENLGGDTVTLIARRWEITDAFGRTQIVEGPGVIGEQPVIEPGSSFTYTSGAPLPTPTGFMRGHYVMATEDGRRLVVEIPAFSLDSPHQTMTLQ